MVINSAGPVSNKNHSKRWLLFKREMRNPAQSDVSDVTLFQSISFLFNPISFYLNVCLWFLFISPGGEEGQFV